MCQRRLWDKRRPWLALCIALVVLCATAGCAREVDVPALADLDWDGQEIFGPGLVKAEQSVLDELPGATRYHIELHMPDDLAQIEAHQEMRYTNREDVSLSEIDLFLMPNYNGGRVVLSALTVDNREIQPTYDYEETLLRVPLPQPLLPGERISLAIDYVLEIPREMGGKYGLFGYLDDVLVLDTFYPAIAAFDEGEWQVQPPSPNGHPFHLDASYYLVRITAPERLSLVATGIEVARQVRQGEQVVLLAGGPARDFYIAASERYTKVSTRIGETTVNSYAFRERKDRARMVLDQTAAALERYNARFGRYPYAEMDIVSTPMRALGVEYPGAMGVSLQLYDPDVKFGDTPSQVYLEATVAHEVAHQWFGNLVGADYADEAWLNEGMAQYATWLFYLDTQGTGAADGFRGSWFGRWDRIDRQEVPLGQPASAFETDAYGAVLYGRAPLFVEALVQEMGEPAFDAFIQDYVAAHRWQVGSGDAFRSLAEQRCTCDLGPLFEDWIYPQEIVLAETPLPTATATPSPTPTPTSTPTLTSTPRPAVTPTATNTPVQPVEVDDPNVVTVCAGGCDYARIQDAIDSPSTEEGMTIYVVDEVHTEGGIVVAKNLTIRGRAGGPSTVQAHERPGKAVDRVFTIAEGANVTIEALTIQHGNPREDTRSGGGILNQGTLTLTHSVVRDNVANCGGGILNDGGILTVVDCTVRDNVADGQAPIGYNCGSGGAVKNVEGGILDMSHCTLVDNRALGKGGALHVSCKSTATLANCTISGNEAVGRGGGIHSKGQLTLVHCTIQGNSAKGVVRGKGIGDQAAGGLAIRGAGTLTMTATLIANNPTDGDCMLGESAVVATNEYNWIEDGSCSPTYTGDPALEPLADNGGTTWTHALPPDSPARGLIPEEACLVRTDQRGLARIPPCDVGAYERNP